MDAKLASFLTFHVFPTGRRLFAMSQVCDEALALGLDDLATHCEKCLALDQLTLDVEHRWAAGGDAARYAPEARHVDILVDVALAALRDALVAATRDAVAFGAPSEAAIALARVAFPRGAEAVMTLPLVDELAELRRIIALLGDPTWAERLPDLKLDRRRARLVELERIYSGAIALPAPAISFAEVKEGRARGQSMMLQAVAMVLGRYASDNPRDLAARGALLAPILRQNEAIDDYLAAHHQIEDVDPETGKAGAA